MGVIRLVTAWSLGALGTLGGCASSTCPRTPVVEDLTEVLSPEDAAWFVQEWAAFDAVTSRSMCMDLTVWGRPTFVEREQGRPKLRMRSASVTSRDRADVWAGLCQVAYIRGIPGHLDDLELSPALRELSFREEEQRLSEREEAWIASCAAGPRAETVPLRMLRRQCGLPWWTDAFERLSTSLWHPDAMQAMTVREALLGAPEALTKPGEARFLVELVPLVYATPEGGYVASGEPVDLGLLQLGSPRVVGALDEHLLVSTSSPRAVWSLGAAGVEKILEEESRDVTYVGGGLTIIDHRQQRWFFDGRTAAYRGYMDGTPVAGGGPDGVAEGVPVVESPLLWLDREPGSLMTHVAGRSVPAVGPLVRHDNVLWSWAMVGEHGLLMRADDDGTAVIGTVCDPPEGAELRYSAAGPQLTWVDDQQQAWSASVTLGPP